MSCHLLACLTVCASFAGEPIPSNRLDAMRQSMESYLSKIKNIHIIYEESIRKPEVPHPLVKAALERERRLFLKYTAPKDRPDLEKRFDRTLSAQSVQQVDLLDAYPSFRLDTKTRQTFPDGSTEDRHILRFVHEGRVTDIDLTHKSVNDNKLIDINILSLLPVHALGRRLQGTLNQPLSTLLELPEVTTLEGAEVIDGVETIIIKVGPPLPPSHRPPSTSERNWVKLWLAPSYDHLPLRAEYYLVSISGRWDGEIVHRTELSDFQPARDEMRGERVLFPRLLTYEQPGGKSQWRVSQVVLNETISTDRFRPSIPPGFLVTRDGVVPTVQLSGGREAQRRAVSETVKSAMDLLAQAPPKSPDVPWPISPRVLVPLGFLVVIGGLFVLRRRNHAT